MHFIELGNLARRLTFLYRATMVLARRSTFDFWDQKELVDFTMVEIMFKYPEHMVSKSSSSR